MFMQWNLFPYYCSLALFLSRTVCYLQDKPAGLFVLVCSLLRVKTWFSSFVMFSCIMNNLAQFKVLLFQFGIHSDRVGLLWPFKLNIVSVVQDFFDLLKGIMCHLSIVIHSLGGTVTFGYLEYFFQNCKSLSFFPFTLSVVEGNVK